MEEKGNDEDTIKVYICKYVSIHKMYKMYKVAYQSPIPIFLRTTWRLSMKKSISTGTDDQHYDGSCICIIVSVETEH